jgi:periplasmic divalent cation tolerance protein
MASHLSTQVIFALTTCESKAQAELLTNELVESRLAACVTTIPGAESSYWWQGKIEKSSEFVLLIKTTRTNLGKIEEVFRSQHPYELPELVALEVTGGSSKYLEWVVGSVG